MKNILTYCSMLALGGLLLAGCADEDTQRVPDLLTGANVRVVANPERAFLDFTDINNSVYEFTVYSENTDIDRAEFMFSYFDISEDSTYDEQMVTVSTFPNTVSLSAAELANLFGLSGPEHFGGADQFNFRTIATMTDGRTFSAANSSPNIVAASGTTSFTALFSTFVGGCTSEIPAGGTWLSVSQQTPFGADRKSGITITPIEGQPNFYQVSDVSNSLYAPFPNFNADQPVQIEDVCNTIFIRSSNGAQPAIVTNTAAGFGPGSYDPATQSIQLPWYDATNSFGDIIILTRE